MRQVPLIVISAAAGGLVVWLAAAWGASEPAPEPHDEGGQVAHLDAGDLARLRSALRSDLSREIETLRAEVRATRSAAPADACATPPCGDAAEAQVEAAEPQAEERAYDPPETEAFRAGREVLDHGLQRGAWTESHRDRIREVMGDMTPREREVLVEEVLLAANNREIQVELLGPPL